MAENLNVKTSAGSWCYDDKADSCAKYGRLYDWWTAKVVCPTGWHLPSRDEWYDLVEKAGGQKGLRDNRVVWFYAGQKLKAKSGWESWGDGNGTDYYHFMALPGGQRNSNGKFENVGKYTFWWTATDSSNYAYHFAVGAYWSDVDEFTDDKGQGYSVRCREDD